MAESLPSSVSAFSHRRTRADSTTSFLYYEDDAANDEAGTSLQLQL
jgi:cation-transporting ATPase 13A3/4/5